MLSPHVVLANATPSDASFNSSVADMTNMVYAAVQAVWTDSTSGTLQVQASNDVGTSSTGAGVSNWEDITGKTLTPSGSAGHGMIHLADIGYKWLRVAYTKNSGSGAITITANCKGF